MLEVLSTNQLQVSVAVLKNTDDVALEKHGDLVRLRGSDVETLLFIAGNEKVGVDPGILELCDRIFFLPMQGHKESLNVSVAFGIALYHIRFGMQISQ